MDYKILEGQHVTMLQGIEHVSESTYWKNICTKFNNVSKLSRQTLAKPVISSKFILNCLNFKVTPPPKKK